jgi:hypothetical protein
MKNIEKVRISISAETICLTVIFPDGKISFRSNRGMLLILNQVREYFPNIDNEDKEVFDLIKQQLLLLAGTIRLKLKRGTD